MSIWITLSFASAVFSRDSSTPVELTAVQARVLRAGSIIVLASVSLGMGAGQWPIWSPAAAAAAYLLWTVVYAEATIQVTRSR